jgi:heat shock protein HslJ
MAIRECKIRKIRREMMKTNKCMQIRLLLGYLFLVILIVGCGPIMIPGTGPDDTNPLVNTSWRLVEIHGQEPIPETEVTLEFTAETLGGRAGCNSFGGSYQADQEGNLEIEDIVQTQIFCEEPEGVMDQEAEYLDALREAASYRLAGERLEILNRVGEITLVFEPS